MNDAHFDAFSRTLLVAHSRRGALAAALGGLGSLLGLATVEAGKGHGKHKHKNKHKKKCKNGRCECPAGTSECFVGGGCNPPGECCPTDKECGGGCIHPDECCDYTERTCSEGGAGGKPVCVAKNTCCPPPYETPCPTASSGCCNVLAGEICTSGSGCCDTISGEYEVCGQFCCDISQTYCCPSPSLGFSICILDGSPCA